MSGTGWGTGPGKPRPYSFRRLLDVAWPSTSIMEVSRILGIHPRQLHRWLHYGLTERQADTLAIAAGLHPSLVWPDWWTHAPGDDLLVR